MQIEQVPATEWEAWLSTNGGILLDVREPVEWAHGTLPGARQVRLFELPETIEDLDKTTPVLIVCRSGSRSQQAAMYMAMSGFESVANLAGGMKALGLQS